MAANKQKLKSVHVHECVRHSILVNVCIKTEIKRHMSTFFAPISDGPYCRGGARDRCRMEAFVAFCDLSQPKAVDP